MKRLTILLLALMVPAAALAQDPGPMLVNEKVMGSASELPYPVAQMTPSDIDQYNIGLRNGITRAFQSHGKTLATDDISIQSQIMPYGSRSIVRSTVITRVSGTYQLVFMGIVGSNLVGVFCTAARPFEASGNDCERQLKQTFGEGGQ